MGEFATKAISGFEVKDADRGEVTAIVSVFNVVDRDGDVILPGAIRDGTSVKLSAYRHDVLTEGAPPVGRGALAVDSTRAVFGGKYFMGASRAQEAFATVKGLGSDSEWSIGYLKDVKTLPLTAEWRAKGAKRLIAEMEVIEVSPVFIGANQFTATVSTKAQADGVSDDVEEDDGLVAEVMKEVAARRLEAKKKKEEEAAEAERVRIAAETKAAEAAEAARMVPLIALRDRYLRIVDEHAPSAQREFERFQKTMARHK